MSHFYLPRFIQERLAIVEGIGGIFWFVEIFARLRLRFITEVCFLGHCLIHRGLSWCWVIDIGWSLEFLPQGVWNGTPPLSPVASVAWLGPRARVIITHWSIVSTVLLLIVFSSNSTWSSSSFVFRLDSKFEDRGQFGCLVVTRSPPSWHRRGGRAILLIIIFFTCDTSYRHHWCFGIQHQRWSHPGLWLVNLLQR